MAITIHGKNYWLWRAVNQYVAVLDVLVQTVSTAGHIRATTGGQVLHGFPEAIEAV